MPQHNASLLQFAAAMSGQYGDALALAQRQVRFPELFGPTNMADGERPAADTLRSWVGSRRPFIMA
jgi:hypothetical protein